MDANYAVEFEQYYEVLRPLRPLYKIGSNGRITSSAERLSVGTIIKGKDLYPLWNRRPKMGKRILEIYCDATAENGPMIRPLAHQVFF